MDEKDSLGIRLAEAATEFNKLEAWKRDYLRAKIEKLADPIENRPDYREILDD